VAKLIEHMPRYYQNATVIKDITRPIDLENEYQETLIADIINQFNVSTATYALARYEKEYGLAISPNISYDERRSRIKAKMRSIGAVNEAMIKNIIKSWTNSNVTIINVSNQQRLNHYTNLELSEFTNLQLTAYAHGGNIVAGEGFEFIIIFDDLVGVPSNMQDVYDAINAIKPAHLIFTYQFKYNKWIDVNSLTWEELEAYTWQEVLEYRIF